jgi:FAD/FMN-containing dehydrogenase
MTTTQVAPFDELTAALRGDLITPDDPRYDEARAVYNGMIDKRPAAIARCRDVADVLACVRFAHDHDVTVSVRGGGHSAAGLGVWNDALVVDLSELRSTTVDPEHRTVRVDAGATLADLDHATGAFGLAVPVGFLANTGIAGLALGGGVGYLSRRFGLTLDNLLTADVVLADGRFVTASADSHPDLFWALRGGGGNFGIVTSFTFRCHPVGENGVVIGGPVFYDVADTPEVMRWYRELLPSLPEELSGWFGLVTIPPVPLFPEELWGRKACAIVWCYTGAHDRADEVLAPIREFGSPLVMGLAPMPFSALQSLFDPLYPPGLQWYWRSDVFTEISDAAIEVHRRYGERLPTGHSTMHLYPIDGAAARVPADATAFPHRGGGWAGVIVGVDPDPANAELIAQWARDYWTDLHPTASSGSYGNFLMDEGEDRVRASFGGNYDRLAQVKALYDPENAFHVNLNIPPAD